MPLRYAWRPKTERLQNKIENEWQRSEQTQYGDWEWPSEWEGEEPPPEEPTKPWWQQGLEYAFYPFTEFGMARRQTGQPWWMPTVTPATQPEQIAARRMGTEEYEEYQALPWTEQLKYEAPAWLMTGLIPGATQARGALAPAVATGGVRGAFAKGTRVALLPPALAEKAAAAGLKYGIFWPLEKTIIKGTTSTVRHSFELALDAGLDKWLVRQGIRADQAPRLFQYFLSTHKHWLFTKAKDNLLRRQARARGKPDPVKVANEAAEDTIKEIEPHLLQASKDLGFAPKPVSKIERLRALLGASETQTNRITELGKERLLISEANQFKPQFRRLLIGMTGQEGTTKTTRTLFAALTKDQADILIEALERLPRASMAGEGKLVPPTISQIKALVPENFFNLKFKEPTPIRLFTSQQYYAEKLGVKPLTEPLELARQRLDWEFRALRKEVSQKIVDTNKAFGVSRVEIMLARLGNRPTSGVEHMRNALNKYEEPPDKYTPLQKKTFMWFRNLNRTIIEGENKVREILGMPPIPYKLGYVRHIADAAAEEILRARYPLPEALKYWSERIVGKRVFNPMAFHRQLATDLEEYFTRDLEYATNAMVWTGLKEIHLAIPLDVFNQQYKAFGKDLPIYEKLTDAELKELQKIGTMPASTRKWMEDYVRHVIKDQPTNLDQQIERLAVTKGLAAVFNKFLRPFGRSLGNRPAANFGYLIGRMQISGGMGWRAKQLIRNKFQLQQNLALYSLVANLKGFLPATPKLQELLDQSWFYKSYTGFEQLPTGIMNKLERLWLGPYQWTAVSNAHQSLKVAYWDTMDLIANPKYAKLGWADPRRTYKEPKEFLYPSEKGKILKEMEFGAGATQYFYINLGMPEIFRHRTLIPLTRFQSWWMNYFTRFLNEGFTRAFKGETGYGAKLPWSRRLNILKYLIVAGAVTSVMGYKMSYLVGVLPSRMSPAIQFIGGLYGYVTADTDYQRMKSLRNIYSAYKVFIPTGLAFQDFYRVFSGEAPIWSLFVYKGGPGYPEEKAAGGGSKYQWPPQ